MPTRKTLTIPCPDPDTLTMIRTYARRTGTDETTAAEHLITYGARVWIRTHRGGKTTAARMTKAETKARSAKAIQARWDRHRARLAAESAPAGRETPPREGGEPKS
jgi:hypothetical protein